MPGLRWQHERESHLSFTAWGEAIGPQNYVRGGVIERTSHSPVLKLANG